MAEDLNSLLQYVGVGITCLVIGFVIIQFASVIRVSHDSIYSRGSIVALADLGVYEDEAATQEVSQIDWGNMTSASSKNETIYVRNEATSVLTLSMTTRNWQPANATAFIICSWDCELKSISPQEIIAATFTLTVFANVTGITTFSFDIVINSEV